MEKPAFKPNPNDPPEKIKPSYPSWIPDSTYVNPSDILNPPDTPDPIAPTSPAVLQKTAPRPIRLAVSAEGALINWHYGQVMAQPKIFAVGTDGAYLVLGLLWGRGEISAVQGVYANKAALSVGYVHNYTGTQLQGVDSWLATAVPGYADTLLGMAYSTVRISQATFTTMPVLAGKLAGLLVYDPRTTLTAYSTNAALFFREAALKGGLGVDDDSITETANACDGLVSGAKRREAGVSFDQPLSLDSILDTLAAYAGGLYVRSGGVARLIPNRPATVSVSFTDNEADGTKLKFLKDSLRIGKASTEASPNRVIVEYTDTSTVPWRRAFATVPDTLPSGDVRTTRLIMPGIHTYAQARREGWERLNYYQATDLEVALTSFDEGLELLEGDLFDVDSADGLTAKAFRATSVARGDDTGHWAIMGREYQNIYSDEALADPLFPDTVLPNPAIVPDAATPSLAEQNYQLQNETWATRIEATWADVTDYAYNHEFEARAYIGSALIWTVRTTGLSAVMGPLQEGQTYTIELRVVGVGGITGNPSTANLLAQGKQLAPTFPGGAQLRGNEAGGRVFLNWDSANDDIWAYEIRFGSSGQTWAQMGFITTTDTLWFTAETIPEGTWDFKVRAIDSVKVESTNELTLAGLEVTSDADSYAQTDVGLGVASSTNMSLQGNDYYPDDGTSWNTLFPNAMNTYTNPLVTYGGNFTTEVISAEHDLGAIVSANFQFATNVELLVGDLDYTMQISDTTGGPYTDYSVLSVNASGRYARLKVTGLLADRFILRPEYFHLVALVNTLTKEGEGTSSATLATTVTLDKEYSKVVSIKIQPISSGGAEDLVGVPDNVVLGPGNTKFDVYIMQGGTQVARDFYYTARVIK